MPVSPFTDATSQHTHPTRSGFARLVRPGRPGRRCLQPRRHRLGPRIHRPRVDHDSRRRFLLLRSASSQERTLHDMAIDGGARNGLVPGT